MTDRPKSIRFDGATLKKIAAIQKALKKKLAPSDRTAVVKMAIQCLWEREVVKCKGDRKT